MKYEPTYRITELDIEVWTWIIERYAATVEDICELRGIKKRTAYEHMQHWVTRGYFYRKGGFILPTQRTYWECGVPYKFHDLGLDFIRHAHTVTKVEHWLKRREDMVILSWTGERALRHEQGISDNPNIYKGADHIPDAVAQIHSKASGIDQEVAIQVERTVKGRERLYSILTKEARDYNQIWYFAFLAQAYTPLKACISTLSPEDVGKFHLWKLDTITCEQKATPHRTQV
jgi:hypothetical protein